MVKYSLMRRPVNVLWAISLAGVAAVLLYVYASIPDEVVIYKATDTDYRITRELFFYASLITIVLPNMVVAIVGYFLKTMKVDQTTVSWFNLFPVIVNIYLVIALFFVEILNSLEKFDFHYFGYLTVVGLIFLLLWVVKMIFLIAKK